MTREPERKEEGDEKRLSMRLVPFRKLGGHGRSVAFPKGSLGRECRTRRACPIGLVRQEHGTPGGWEGVGLRSSGTNGQRVYEQTVSIKGKGFMNFWYRA